MGDDVYTLPDGLPVPEDDGGADHLTELELPNLVLPSSLGEVDLRDYNVIYIYPRAGRPGQALLPGWNETPGARGCTPQSCSFRDLYPDLGVPVAGLSAQTLDDQLEFAERNRMPFPVIADPERELAAGLSLPTFEIAGLTLYKRMTLIAPQGRIAKVFYPVFPPDRNAEEVLAWLRTQS
jgi:peroxiredoxin